MHGRLGVHGKRQLGLNRGDHQLDGTAGVADKSMATIQVQGHQFVFDQHGETVAAVSVNNLGGDFLADLKRGQRLGGGAGKFKGGFAAFPQQTCQLLGIGLEGRRNRDHDLARRYRATISSASLREIPQRVATSAAGMPWRASSMA